MGKKDSWVRIAVVVVAGVAGVALWMRESGDAIVFGRYSLAYFFVLLGYIPLLMGALVFAVVGRDMALGLRRVMRSAVSWLVILFILLPTVWVSLRYVEMGAQMDLVRALALSSLAAGFALIAVGLGSRQGSRPFQWFQGISLTLIGALYVATFSITPLFGTWIERNWGLPGDTSLRLTQQAEYPPGITHEPGATFLYTGRPGQVPEFAVQVRNNSHGFHDRERTFENPGGVRRIVVLGDNYVHAPEVPREKGFPALLEEWLSPEFEVIPLARRGIGQEVELELLEEFGARLEPEIVILVWATNDLLDNDPELMAMTTWMPDAILSRGLLLDRLATGWLQKRLYHLDERFRLGALRPDYWAYLEPMPSAVEAAFGRTEALLDEVVAECEVIGCKVVLTVKRPTNELRWLRRFPGLRSYSFNPDAHAEWLAAYSEARGIEFVDLGPPFQSYYDDHPTGHPEQYSFPNAGFLNEYGHELAAEVIHEALLSGGVLHDRNKARVRP